MNRTESLHVRYAMFGLGFGVIIGTHLEFKNTFEMVVVAFIPLLAICFMTRRKI